MRTSHTTWQIKAKVVHETNNSCRLSQDTKHPLRAAPDKIYPQTGQPSKDPKPRSTHMSNNDSITISDQALKRQRHWKALAERLGNLEESELERRPSLQTM